MIAFIFDFLIFSGNRQFFDRNLDVAQPFGKQIAYQASLISAAQPDRFSVLRFGGSGNDYLTYEFGNTKCPPQGEYTECMNQTWWTNLLEFTKASNAKILFGLSMNTGHDLESGSGNGDPGFPWPWDPSNAKEILTWTLKQGCAPLTRSTATLLACYLVTCYRATFLSTNS